MVFVLRKDKDEFTKIISRVFEKQGWKISTPRNTFLDIEAGRGGVKFFIQCVDRTILGFNSVRQIMDEAEETSRIQASLKKAGVIYIVNFQLMASLLEPLKRGVIVFHQDELDALINLDKRFENLSFREDPRLEFLASNVIGFALIASNSYRKQNDILNAIEWAERAVVAGRGFSHAYRALYRLLLTIKDYEGAEKAMLGGLALQPSNLEVIESLIEVAQIQKDPKKVDAYKRRLESVMDGENVRINNFSELIKRTQNNAERSAGAAVAQAPPSSSASTKPAGGGFLGLFKRKPS